MVYLMGLVSILIANLSLTMTLWDYEGKKRKSAREEGYNSFFYLDIGEIFSNFRRNILRHGYRTDY